MARSTGDGTDEGAMPQPSEAPAPPPETPAAVSKSADIRVRVTGPAFTDAVEVEVDGQRLTVRTSATAVPAASADAVIAAASELGITVEKVEG